MMCACYGSPYRPADTTFKCYWCGARKCYWCGARLVAPKSNLKDSRREADTPKSQDSPLGNRKSSTNLFCLRV